MAVVLRIQRRPVMWSPAVSCSSNCSIAWITWGVFSVTLRPPPGCRRRPLQHWLVDQFAAPLGHGVRVQTEQVGDEAVVVVSQRFQARKQTPLRARNQRGHHVKAGPRRHHPVRDSSRRIRDRDPRVNNHRPARIGNGPRRRGVASQRIGRQNNVVPKRCCALSSCIFITRSRNQVLMAVHRLTLFPVSSGSGYRR